MDNEKELEDINTDLADDHIILLIEKDDDMKRFLIFAFIKNGIRVIVARDTLEAKSILENENYKFDAVITNLDVELTKCLQFCELIRSQYTSLELPFIGYTSNANSQMISNIFSLGYNDFFSLPFNPVEFNHRMKIILEAKKLKDTNKKLRNLIDIRTQVFKMNTHDLKNPLSSIFSLSGIPVSSFNDAEEISETFNVIHNASKIMMSLVNANLDFFNVTSDTITLKKDTVDVIGIINQVIEINTPLANNKKQKIIYNYPNTNCVIKSDTSKLYQAINNIVSNAIKFSPFEKNIWIDVSKDEKAKIIIKIRDEGPGFKKEEIDTVLIKFGKHSATPTGDEISTGLGLLITKQIVNLSNGDIYLESEEGKGTTFTLEFPTGGDLEGINLH